MALSASKIVKTSQPHVSQRRWFPVKASTTIYQGGIVGNSSGYARELVVGDNFMGIALAECVNAVATDGGSVAAPANVEVQVDGCFWTPTITGADGADDYGKKVYATDDNTEALSLTQTATLVGRIEGYTAADGFCVRMITQCFRDVT